MRKSTKDNQAEGMDESTTASTPKRRPGRRAVVKTDRTVEEWSPSVDAITTEPKAAAEEVAPESVASTPPPPSEELVATANLPQTGNEAGEEAIAQAPQKQFVPVAPIPAPISNPIQGPNGQQRQNRHQGQLSPREERLAKWGRYNRENRKARRAALQPGYVSAQQGQPTDGQTPAVPGTDGQPVVQQERLPQPPPPPPPQLPTISLNELEDISPEELNKRLETVLTPEEIAGTWKKHDLINHFVRAYMRRGGMVLTSGIIEVTNDGSGFLRSEKSSYLSCPEDVYVSQQYVRRFNLRTGDFIEGPIRDPRLRPDRGKEKFLALGHIDKVNGRAPSEWRRVIPFENLTPIFPDRRIFLEGEKEELSMRVMNLFSPIGFGQRGIIVAPPRTGKTVLMQKIANAITRNHPDAYLIVLLIDERPEEVTDMQRNTKAHVVSSTFDEAPERHAQVAEMVIEMSKRMVESGKDVIILLDSITRLARAYNTLQPNSGRILSGGVDAMGLHKPKRFFGAARNIEGGGSLTIIATALIDTGSRMDEVIFEEFKGTGNMELVLDRNLSDKRIYPAINIEASGTRKEDLILHPDELQRIWSVRKALSGIPTHDVMETVIKAMKKTASNAEFLMNVALKN